MTERLSYEEYRKLPIPKGGKYRKNGIDRDGHIVPATVLEIRFGNYLRELEMIGDILSWKFQKIQFFLTDNKLSSKRQVTYKPDFYALYDDGKFVVYETKGYWREDDRIKIKLAADQNPAFEFYGVMEKNNEFIYEAFHDTIAHTQRH